MGPLLVLALLSPSPLARRADAVGADTVRMIWDAGKPPAPAASLFLAGPPAPGQPVDEGAMTVEVAAGMDNGRVTLRIPSRPEELLYGSGNGSRGLAQDAGISRVGNGVAVVPFYWSTAGYAVLAITDDDLRPAQWRREDDGSAITWSFPDGHAELYLMRAATFADAERDYAALVGPAPVPPRWAFGYLQSRWGWVDRAYIEDTARQFRSRKLPVDAFIFDFEWYTPVPDYKLPPEGLPHFPDFAWNPKLFPDPAAQVAALNAQGIQAIGIRKPRLGDAATLKDFHRRGWISPLQPGDEPYHLRDIDFARAEVREWYQRHLDPLIDVALSRRSGAISGGDAASTTGIAGWWNDEGEGTYTKYYGWNTAERVANDRLRPGERFWSLNRAFAPGLARLGAAAWTGDIDTSWAVLQATPAALLNWAVAGMPYSACDIGGFKREDSPDLLARWMEAGVFFPVMRAHSTVTVRPRFPWLYGPEAEQAIRGALDLRYRLIPYYYSLAHETARTGLPWMRPMTMEFPDDAGLRTCADEWMLGHDLLAAPVLQPGTQRDVALPAGGWYRWEDGHRLAGAQTIAVHADLADIPLYVREGSVIPVGPVVQSTRNLPGGPLEVAVYPGAEGTGVLVEDDGQSVHGPERRTELVWHDAERRLTWSQSGGYDGSDRFRAMIVQVFTPDGPIASPEQPLTESGSWTADSRK